LSQPVLVNAKSKIIDLTGPTSPESSPTTDKAGAASPPRATIILSRNSSSLLLDTSTAKGGFSNKKKKNSNKSTSGSSSKKRKSGQQPGKSEVCPEVLETKIAGSSGCGSSALGASAGTDLIETGPGTIVEAVADEMVVDDDSAQLGCIARGEKGDEGPTADVHENQNDNMATETDDGMVPAVTLISGDA